MFKYIIYSYINYLSSLLLVTGVSILFIIICYMLSNSNWYFEKNTSYECGFDPFSDTREPFEVKFYLISILFILFDVEILIFIPWIISIKQLLLFGYYISYIFYLILAIAFLYEIKKKTLDFF